MSGLLRNLWQRLIAPAAPKPPQMPPVIVVDPEADKAHDLDDPFFDRAIQTRMGDVIAHAGKHQKK